MARESGGQTQGKPNYLITRNKQENRKTGLLKRASYEARMLMSQACARIETWHLQFFNFEVLYSKGDLIPEDYISRHLKAMQSVLSSPNLRSSMWTSSCLKPHLWFWAEKRSVTQRFQKNASLQDVMCFISTGQWDNLKPMEGVNPSTLKIFANVHSEQTSEDGNLALCGSRTVVFDALQ